MVYFCDFLGLTLIKLQVQCHFTNLDHHKQPTRHTKKNKSKINAKLTVASQTVNNCLDIAPIHQYCVFFCSVISFLARNLPRALWLHNTDMVSFKTVFI